MRILFVAMARTIHTASWTCQLADQGRDIHLLSRIDGIPVWPEMRGVDMHRSVYAKQEDLGQDIRLKGSPICPESVAQAAINLLEKRCPGHRRYLSQKSPGLAETVACPR